MSTPIELARKEGYSDKEITDYLSKKNPRVQEALKEGYTIDEVSKFLSSKAPQEDNKDSPGRGLARTLYQPIGGALSFTSPALLGQLSSLIGTGEALAELPELQERLPELKKKFPMLNWPDEIDEEKYSQALETSQKYSPTTVSGLEQIIEDLTGTPLRPKTRGQELVRLGAEAAKGAPKGLIPKTTAALGVPDIARNLESLGVPKDIADTTALGLSLIRLPEKSEKIKPTIKGKEQVPPKGPSSAPPGIPPEVEIERLPSGLTKPRAMEAKRPEMGIITPSQQEKAIENLNKEAAKLTKERFHESFPTAKKLEEGFDFEVAFKKGFGELEMQAAKANPQIEIAPFTKFLREEQAKYRGIPKLDKEAKKIVSWIEAFREQPQTELKNLMKIYRSVNRELKGIYDRAKISGIPNQYVNFLTRANQEIANSIRNTIPKNSEWMSRFDNLNKVYKNFRDAETMSNKLRPLLQGEPTAANLRRIANDPKIHKLLEVKMGKEAAKDIVQIAKDLDSAVKSINRLSSKTIKELDDIYPIPLLFAGLKIPGLGYVVKKLSEVVRRTYGTNLLKPSTRQVYREAIKAAGEGNLGAYKKATEALQKESGLIGYTEPKRLEYKP